MKQVLLPELDRPYAFYGHSAGAFLAYRLTYKLWSELDNKPGHLFVGAYSSPTILPNPVISFAREEFKKRGYDEIPGPESLSPDMPETRKAVLAVTDAVMGTGLELQSALSASQELHQLFLPTALAELQMIRNYNRVDTLLFDVPITAFHGKRDDKVRKPEMNAWRKLTRGSFSLHTLPGGHLFLHEDQNQKQLLELISRDLEKYK